MKKKAIIILSVCLASVLAVVSFPMMEKVTTLTYFTVVSMWKPTVEFEEYQDDFEIVKNYILENFAEEDCYFVPPTGNDGAYSSEKGYLDLPIEVKEAFESCKTAFDPDDPLDLIRVEENRLYFCTANGRYSLIYSENGRPSKAYVREEGRFVTQKAENGWYHAVSIPKMI